VGFSVLKPTTTSWFRLGPSGFGCLCVGLSAVRPCVLLCCAQKLGGHFVYQGRWSSVQIRAHPFVGAQLQGSYRRWGVEVLVAA